MDKLERLITSGIARGIGEELTKKALHCNGQRDKKISQLRELGYSLSDIGQFFDLSRQRVSQILGPNSGKTAAKNPGLPLGIRENIWREAAKSPALWWGKSGKLNQRRIVASFLELGHSWAESRKLAKGVQGSKLDVILFASFDVECSDLAHTAFFNRLAADMLKYDILDHINAKQPLQATKRLFDRRWADLGIRAKKRDV